MARRKQGSDVLTSAAVGIGRTLGQVMARVEALKKERHVVAAELRRLVDTGQRLLRELGPGVEKQVGSTGAARGGDADVVKSKGGRKKGFKVSAATKRKLREAWKRRKAAATAK